MVLPPFSCSISKGGESPAPRTIQQSASHNKSSIIRGFEWTDAPLCLRKGTSCPQCWKCQLKRSTNQTGYPWTWFFQCYKERSEPNAGSGYSLGRKLKLIFQSPYTPYDTGWRPIQCCTYYTTIALCESFGLWLALFGMWVALSKTTCLGANTSLEIICSHTHHILDNITNYMCDWLLDYDDTWYDTNGPFRRKRSGYNKRWPHEKQCSSGRHGRCRCRKRQYQTTHVRLRNKVKMHESKRKVDTMHTQQKGTPTIDDYHTYKSRLDNNYTLI